MPARARSWYTARARRFRETFKSFSGFSFADPDFPDFRESLNTFFEFPGFKIDVCFLCTRFRESQKSFLAFADRGNERLSRKRLARGVYFFYIYVYIYIYIYIYIYVCMYIYTYMCAFLYIYSAYTHMNIYKCTRIVPGFL